VQITYPDFHLYEMLDQHRTFEPSLFDDAANLKVGREGGVGVSPQVPSYLFIQVMC